MTNRRNESNSHAFIRRAVETSGKELVLLLLILIIIVVALVVSCNKKKDPPSSETINTPTPVGSVSNTPTASVPASDSPTPTEVIATATPTPTVYVYGSCESVTDDTNSVPIEKDGWAIDYLMLVNWDHRLKYSGNPENLVRLDEVLDPNLYHLQDPITVSQKERDYVIVSEDDNYLRGNAVAAEALNEMCLAVMAQGCNYVKISQTGSYRNYATQNQFWQNRLAADPHYGDNPYKTLPKTVPGNVSEHRTGLGFDIWLGPTGDDDASYEWLEDNCYRYGFILRYPGNKTKITGIQYERWHFRYVGVEAATEIHNLGYCLEEYIAYKNGEALPDGTHTPTPTPSPSPSPTPTESPEASPSPTPEATDTPTPMNTLTPTITPTNTPTKDPGATVTPTSPNTPTPIPKGPTNPPTPTTDPWDGWGDSGAGGQGT